MLKLIQKKEVEVLYESLQPIDIKINKEERWDALTESLVEIKFGD